MKLSLVRLAVTVMGEVGAHNIFDGASFAVVGWHSYGDVGAHNIIHGASITMVSWHGYRRGRGPRYISPNQHYCGWLASLWARAGPITYFTKPELLWFTGMVMGEVEAHDILNRVSITVICWNGYGAILAHDIFHGGSTTVVGWHGYKRGRAHNISH